MSKYRHELKYIISTQIAEILKQRLKLVMSIDNHSIDGEYQIKSLYFDDRASTAYYEKLDGILFRKKYRIRIYNNDDKIIRLEKKLKCNNMTEKRQVKISKPDCIKILNGNYNIDTDEELFKEFIMFLKGGSIPSVIVSYKRIAYTYPISDVRITFDEDLKSGLFNYDLFDNKKPLYNIYDENEVVLEVKFNEVIPEQIAIVLSTVPMFKQAVSKFARCRGIK